LSIDIAQKPQVLRIVSGSPAEAEREVNALGSDYSIMAYTFSVVKDEMKITFLLMHQSELRKMAIANPTLPPGMRQ
jgi:hypothetical protein